MTPMALTGHKNYEDQAAEKYNQLTSLNLNEKTESKNGLSYVSWANAWKAFKEVFPTATYRIIKDPKTNMPYFVDPLLGIMVFTEVTANGLTYEMWLPVMDSANKAIKAEAYTYKVWDKINRQYVEKKVEAATMFDINKTLMRCLVKNLAMYGLGIYIYAGEDMPESQEENAISETPQQQAKTRKPRKQTVDRYNAIRQAINETQSTQDLMLLYQQHPEVANNPQIKALFTARKQELLNVA
ncbi:MAG: DUF1071 domain-containing protein [Muribaculaceae bacterium]|nr:DUF1071 domain-containing protein [Muribaculaceae bacterium]